VKVLSPQRKTDPKEQEQNPDIDANIKFIPFAPDIYDSFLPKSGVIIKQGKK
jgi:hypothetical protein